MVGTLSGGDPWSSRMLNKLSKNVPGDPKTIFGQSADQIWGRPSADPPRTTPMQFFVCLVQYFDVINYALNSTIDYNRVLY